MGAEPTTILDINGRPVPVRLRRNGRARRILLRLDNHGDGVIVTLPKGVPEAEGVAWAEKQAVWVASRLSAMPTRTLFSKGAVIPFEGKGHVIRHTPDARRGVWRESGEIRVSGQPEHLARRVRDWLKKEARMRLSEQSADASKRRACESTTSIFLQSSTNFPPFHPYNSSSTSSFIVMVLPT